MGTRYVTILSGGDVPNYNDNPPPDDNSQTEANRVKYSTVTSDLTDPLHSGQQVNDDQLVKHFDEGPAVKTGNYTTDVDDYNTVLECTGSFTTTLFTPATAGKSYRVTVKNIGTGVVTVESASGNIDGKSCFKLGQNQAATFFVNDAENGYYTKHTAHEFEQDTTMVFYQSSPPTGWTIITLTDDHVLRVNCNSAGTTGGLYTFDDIFINGVGEADPYGITDHVLTAAESGVPAHSHEIDPTATSQDNTGVTPAGTTGGSAGTFNTDNNTPQDAAQGHTHGLDIRVQWASTLIASKDGGCTGGGSCQGGGPPPP